MLSKKVASYQSLTNDIYKLIMRSPDDSVIRKGLRVYSGMAQSGMALTGIINAQELY